MANRCTANYANIYGETEVNMKQNINFCPTIRIIKAGNKVLERCPSCSGFQLSKGKIKLSFSSNFSHKKGCKLA